MKLSQNFLVDKYFIEKFISYIVFQRPIIEVGCGKGNISKYINPDICIEIDSSFIKFLKEYNLVIADARKIPIYRGQVISSLPYSITEDFFEEVISINGINRLVLILQKDFVDKIKFYSSSISFLLNYYFKIASFEVIPPSSFYPRPKVYSQIVVLERIRNYNQEISKILKCIGRFRNKKLRNAARLCGINSTEDKKKVRDFKPCQVLELLSSLDIKFA